MNVPFDESSMDHKMCFFTADNGTQSFSCQKIDFEYFAVKALLRTGTYITYNLFITAIFCSIFDKK